MGCAHASSAAVVQTAAAPQGSRPGSRILTLVKEHDDYLGLKLKQGQWGVQVASVIEGQGGLVEKWNAENPSMAVRPSDWLVSLNSVRVFYLTPIIEELRRTGPLEIMFTERPNDTSVFGLQHRDFSEADFDALLALDLSIAPKCAARAANIIRHLPLVEVDASSEARHSGHQCSICLETLNKEDKVAQLPCKHLFHRHCIAGWLQQGISTLATTAKCPNCAQPMEDGLLVAAATTYTTGEPEAQEHEHALDEATALSRDPDAERVEGCNTAEAVVTVVEMDSATGGGRWTDGEVVVPLEAGLPPAGQRVVVSM